MYKVSLPWASQTWGAVCLEGLLSSSWAQAFATPGALLRHASLTLVVGKLVVACTLADIRWVVAGILCFLFLRLWNTWTEAKQW